MPVYVLAQISKSCFEYNVVFKFRAPNLDRVVEYILENASKFIGVINFSEFIKYIHENYLEVCQHAELDIGELPSDDEDARERVEEIFQEHDEVFVPLLKQFYSTEDIVKIVESRKDDICFLQIYNKKDRVHRMLFTGDIIRLD